MAAQQLLTVPQAAERLSVSPDQIYALVHAGKLSYVRVSIGDKKGALRFTEADLDAFIQRNRHVAAADREQPDVSRVPHRMPRRSLDLPEAKRYA